MTTPNKQFDPFVMAERLESDFAIKVRELMMVAGQLEWAMEKCRQENERLAAGRLDMDVFTEAEAAAMLRYECADTLAAHRRQFNFEHIKHARTICYTREQLLAVRDFLTVHKGRKSGASQLKAA